MSNDLITLAFRYRRGLEHADTSGMISVIGSVIKNEERFIPLNLSKNKRSENDFGFSNIIEIP